MYKCVVDENNKQNEFFNEFSFDKSIREVRNDIVGHPANRKKIQSFILSLKEQFPRTDLFIAVIHQNSELLKST